MWDETKQKQLDEYRRREEEGSLSDEERSILAERLIEVEETEWATLKPALERQHSEQKQLQTEVDRLRSQNKNLVTLAQKCEELLLRVKRFIPQGEAKRSGVQGLPCKTTKQTLNSTRQSKL